MDANANNNADNAKPVPVAPDRQVFAQLIQTLDALADYCETFGDEPAEMVRRFSVRRVLGIARASLPVVAIAERIVCNRCGAAVPVGEESVRTLCAKCEAEVKP